MIGGEELDKLFERYRRAPHSFVFAPLADACRKAGRIDEAIEICENGLKLHPEYTSAHVVLAKCFHDQGKAKEAEAEFNKVLSLDPENLVALKYLGMMAAERGNKVEAVSYFTHILEMDPDNEEILAKFAELDDSDDEEILDLKPIEDDEFEGKEIVLGEDDVATSDELATVTLADIFAAQGYKEKAIKIYREVLSKDPDNAVVRDKLAALAGEPEVLEARPLEEDLESKPEVSEDPAGAAPETGEEEPEREEASVEDGPPGENEAADKREQAPEDEAEEAEDPQTRPGGKYIDEKKSMEQFKNWLRNAGR